MEDRRGPSGKYVRLGDAAKVSQENSGRDDDKKVRSSGATAAAAAD
jgi:hypothetical protein